MVLASGVCAQTKNPAQAGHLSLDEVVARMSASDEARAAALRHYSSTRRYTLRNVRFGTSAQLAVEMQYQRPGIKTFQVTSEKGSAIIRDRVLKRLIKAEVEASRPEVLATTRITPGNYTFKLQTFETCGERRCYVLEAIPKVQSKFLFRGRVWLDSEDFAISRIEGAPAVNPSFWIKKTAFVHEYAKFGSFWLPVANRSTTEARIFGRTEVSIEYSLYRINEAGSAGDGGDGKEAVTPDGQGKNDGHN